MGPNVLFAQELARNFCDRCLTRLGKFISIVPTRAHIFSFDPVFNSPSGLTTLGGGPVLPAVADALGADALASAPGGFGAGANGVDPVLGVAGGFGADAFGISAAADADAVAICGGGYGGCCRP